MARRPILPALVLALLTSVTPAAADALDADVAIEKVASPTSVSQGTLLRYVLRARNLGPDVASGVTVTDPLPAGVTVVSVSPSCSHVLGNHTTTCELGTLAPGEVATASIVVTATQVGTHENAATVTSDADPEPANDEATVPVTITPLVTFGPAATTSTGTVVTDPDTGHLTVTMAGDDPSDLVITTDAACPPGSSPAGPPTLSLGPFSTAMTETEPGSYTGTVPAAEVRDGEVSASLTCDEEEHLNALATVALFDPIGVLTDMETGQPVEDAVVTLHRVPGWRASTGPADVGDDVCESADSKPMGEPWTQEAPTSQGVPADPHSGLIHPGLNPVATNAAGRFGWELAAGCWYVVVEKEGHLPVTSPVVGAPPPVADLDLELEAVSEPIGRSITLEASATRRIFGQTVRIRGSVLSDVLACRAGVPVTIERRVLGTDAFVHVATAVTNGTGAYSHPMKADVSAAYRALLDGPAGCSAAQASATQVGVAMKVGLRASRKAVPAGKRVRLVATYRPCPGHGGLRIELLAGKRVVASKGPAGCKAAFRVKVARPTTFRATVEKPHADHEAGRSTQVRVKLRR